MKWRVYLDPLIKFGHPGYRLFVGIENQDGSFDVMNAPLMQHHSPMMTMGEKDALMDDSKHPTEGVRDFLQAMSDAAWDIGIRPKQIESHASELRATKYHLEDMRKIAGVDAPRNIGVENTRTLAR